MTRQEACSAGFPSGRRATLATMWIAHVICSGQECTEELEIVIDTLDELEELNCECGFGFAVLSVAEATLTQVTIAEVVPISSERRDPRRLAA